MSINSFIIASVFKDPFLFKQTENIMNYLMVSIMALAIIGLFINYRTVKIPVFTATIIVILLFDVNLFLVNHLSSKETGFLPFKALFGPLFFLHIKMFNQARVSKRSLAWHALFPLFLFLVFFYLLFFRNLSDSMFSAYLIILAEGISMFFYGLYALLPRHTQHSSKLRDIISICSIVFILDAAFTILNTVSALKSQDFDIHNLHFINDPFYFVSVLLGWVYFFCSISMMINPDEILYPSLHRLSVDEKEEETADGEDHSYKKGRLSEDTLLEMEGKLSALMLTEKVYLKNDLTLSDLARQLKVTNPHLTQLLNIKIGLNFYQYVNRLRVNHAIEELQNRGGNITLEELSYICGFNNRASFNRYFKEVTGMQPSVYVKTKIQSL